MPRELEVVTTPNLRAVTVLDQRWDEETVAWASSMREYLREIGRQAVLETRTQWQSMDFADGWSVVG